VKASPVAGPRGFDGAKKVYDVKRHVLVHSAGILAAAVVTAANLHDRNAFPRLLRQAKHIAPSIAHAWVDTYTGSTVADAAAHRHGDRRRCVRAQTRPTVHSAAAPVGG
jgi:Transposase DDE domain